MRHHAFAAAVCIAVLGASSCSGTTTAAPTVTVTAPAPTVTVTAPAPTVTATAPTATPSESTSAPSVASENPTPQASPEPDFSTVGLQFADVTCASLSEEAAGISVGQDVELIKVRSPKVVRDNRKTLKLPKGTKDALVMSCKGRGVWSDSDNSSVLVSLTIDADGDAFIAYKEL